MNLPATTDQRKIIATALRTNQKAEPANLSLAHTVGLFHYWWAKALEQEGQLRLAGEAWLTVISSWTSVLADDTFLHKWCKSRSDIYQIDIGQDGIEILRNQLKEKLQADLTDFTERCEQAGQALYTEPLYLVFELEMTAFRTLKQIGGFPISADTSAKIGCGPLMLRQLGLSSAFGNFLVNSNSSVKDVPDVLADLFNIVKGKSSDSLDNETRIKLMQYFSQLGIAAVCLERSHPEQTLSSLAALYPRLKAPAYVQYSDEGSHAGRLPLVFAENSPQFSEHNPGYSRTEQPGKIMFEHAKQLALAAHMRVAELSITTDPMDVQQAVLAWQNAITLGREMGQNGQVSTDIQNMIIGRAIALDRTRRLEEAIALLEATVEAYPSNALQRKYAELLTDRGVKAGNEEQWENSVIDLRRAYKFDAYTPRTRDNLVIALRGWATQNFAVDHYDQSRALLTEAITVLEAAIAGDLDNSDLQDELRGVQSELAMVQMAQMLSQSSDISAFEIRAASLLKEEKLDEAEAEARKAIQTSPLRKQGFILLSRIFARKKNIEGVVEMQQRIVELDSSERFNAEINIGKAYEDTERYGEALDHFWQAAIAASDDVERSRSCELMADVLIAQERFDEAEAMVERSLKLNPENKGAQASRLHLRLARAQKIGTDKEMGAESLMELLGELAALAEDDEEEEDEKEEGPAISQVSTSERLVQPSPLSTANLDERVETGTSTESSGGIRRLWQAFRRVFGGSTPPAPVVDSSRESVPGVQRGKARSQESAVDTVERYLQGQGLRYRRLSSGTFSLAFDAQIRNSIMVQLRVKDNVIIAAAPLPKELSGEAAVLYSMLRATYTTDTFKLCRTESGELYVAAEVPLDVLSAELLNGLIRGAVQIVDQHPSSLADLDRMVDLSEEIQRRATLQEVLLDLGAVHNSKPATMIPIFARQQGITCQRLDEGRFLLIFGAMGFKVRAICPGRSVSFLATIGDARPRRGNLRYYQRMAEINTEMYVCKIALDSDDDPCFLWELPALSEETFRQMVEHMDMYLMRFGMELFLLAQGD